ncbi:MAG: hypothetical protein K6G15_00755 [Desulfovibrio sp.]|nr:hypothetical protein [Desulfovibrio sp.]
MLFVLLLSLPFLFFLLRALNRYRLRQQALRNKAIILETLQTAQLQNQNFEIQLGEQNNRVSYSSILDHISDDTLEFNVLHHVSSVWVDNKADIFFSYLEKGIRHFHKFHVPIVSINARQKSSTVYTSLPQSLEIGQKRAFFRIAPLPNTVRVLAIWLLAPSEPLPRSTDEVGPPFLSCKIRRDGSPAQDIFSLHVEDISGSGIGLRLQTTAEDERIVKDGQILCLLVYNESMHGEEHLVNFCCTGRISNIRQAQDNDATKILGIEFTNWALLEKGNKNINWFHQAKATGIGPILQWVTKMDIEQRKIP